jgi:hypothetical protein
MGSHSLYVAALTAHAVPASSPAVGSPAGTTTFEAGAAGLLARGVLLPVCLSKDTAELAQATQLSLADADAPPSGSSRRSSSSGGPPCDAGTLIALSRDQPGLVQVKFSRLRPFFSPGRARATAAPRLFGSSQF